MADDAEQLPVLSHALMVIVTLMLPIYTGSVTTAVPVSPNAGHGLTWSTQIVFENTFRPVALLIAEIVTFCNAVFSVMAKSTFTSGTELMYPFAGFIIFTTGGRVSAPAGGVDA